MLLGRDPFEIARLHAELGQGTVYRQAAVWACMPFGEVDVALHDLVGKQLGRPLPAARWREARRSPCDRLRRPGRRRIGQMMDDVAARFERALDLGFTAVKMEVLFEDLVTDAGLVECIREGRRLLGEEVTMMVDFGYRWSDWREALWTLRRVEDCNVYFAEATLRHDDLAGHARLAERVETRVCGAEFAATVDECREWLERGRVDVLQADINRCGGLTEVGGLRSGRAHGALVIPHCWKTGVTAAASRHFQAATPNAPTSRCSIPTCTSRRFAELTGPEPEIRDGPIGLPTAAGLGIEIDEAVVERYRIDG